MNTLLAWLVSALSLLLSATPVAAAAPERAEMAATAPERVLFIGNSHTRRHGGLDWLVGNFVAAAEAPRAFEGKVLADGGVTLAHHWQNSAVTHILEGDYDTVVLQGYLPGASIPSTEPFLEHARLFDEVITSSGAETVLFMTWPQGPDDWSTLEDAIEAHRLLEQELGAVVAPAALAFERARTERPNLPLIDPDRIHSTWEGGYLAAATVYAALYERSPEGLAYDFGVGPETAAFLQRVAWETLQEWRAGNQTDVPATGDGYSSPGYSELTRSPW